MQQRYLPKNLSNPIPVYLRYLQQVNKERLGEFYKGIAFSQSKRHQSNAYIKSAPYKPTYYETSLL